MYRKYFIHIVLAVTFVSQGIQAQTLITLEKALEIAGSNSPEIQKSYLNMERYRESLNAQRAAYKSKFQLNVTPFSYESNRSFNTFFSQWNNEETTQSYGVFSVSQPILHTDATISLNNRFGWQNNYSEFKDTTTTSFTNNLYLQVTQPLFTYNKAKMQLRELELDYENSNLSYSIQMLNLERSVSQYFYQVYMAQMSVTIARDELDKTQQSYEIIKNKVDAGLAAVEQFYQAELNLMNAKSTLQNREVELENTKDEFKLYIGMPLSEPIATLTDISVNPVNVNLENAVSYALAARMELRQRQIDLEYSHNQLVKARETNDFNGDVTLSLGLFGDNEKPANVYENPTQSPKVAVSFNIPIFDWGQRKSTIRAQEAMVKSSEINLDNEKKQIEMNIRKIYRSLQNQLTQIEIARQNEKNAQLTYEINLERYRNGDLTSMDLKLYQNQLSEKKMSLLQAQINYKLELLNLKIQSLYDFELNQPIVPSNLFKNK
jgi:outer membrane protein TolC